jgi:hypothetical protein
MTATREPSLPALDEEHGPDDRDCHVPGMDVEVAVSLLRGVDDDVATLQADHEPIVCALDGQLRVRAHLDLRPIGQRDLRARITSRVALRPSRPQNRGG